MKAHISKPSNPYLIQAVTSRIGEDYLITITGGAAHIGAVATAYVMDGQTHTLTQVVPGHREGELATEVAGQAAELLKRTVTVVMGVHIDNASKAQIIDMVYWIRTVAQKELAELAEHADA